MVPRSKFKPTNQDYVYDRQGNRMPAPITTPQPAVNRQGYVSPPVTSTYTPIVGFGTSPGRVSGVESPEYYSPYSMFDLGQGRTLNRQYWQDEADRKAIEERATKKGSAAAERNNQLQEMIDALLSGASSGGGGGMSAMEQRQLAGIQTLADALGGQLASGSYKEPYQQLGKRLAKTYGRAAKKVRGTYSDLEQELRNATNPYEGFVAESGVAEPGLMEYLSQMGGDTTGLGMEVAGNREAAAQQAAAFQNIANMMAQQTALNNAGRLGDAQMGRAGTLADLLTNRAAYSSAIQQQQEQQRRSLYDLLAQLATQGADVGRFL